MPSISNSNIKNRGSNNNFGNIIGLNEKEVKEIVEKAKVEILQQVVDSGSNVMSSIADATNGVLETLSDMIRSKLHEFLWKIDERSSKTEENIEKSMRSNADAIKKDLTPLITDIRDDILSVYEDVKKTGEQQEQMLNATFDRLARRYEYYYQQSENQYHTLLTAINKLVTNYEISLKKGMKCIQNAQFDIATKLLDDASKSPRTDLKSYAFFGLALADRHVQLIWDYKRDQWQPILHDYSDERRSFSIDNTYYSLAKEFAGDDDNLIAEYGKLADRIDNSLTTYWNYLREEKVSENDMESWGRDCFISVKISDSKTGKDTDDCTWIENSGLYQKLQDKNLRPFFSRKDIEENASDDVYEAKILYALNKAQCLVLVCSDSSHLSTPWVKNEYTRFLNRLKVDKKGLKQDQLMIISNDKLIDISALALPFEHTQYFRSQYSIDQLVEKIEEKVDRARGCANESVWYCSQCGFPHNEGFDTCTRKGCGGKVVDALEYVNTQNTRKNAEILKLKSEKEILEERLNVSENEKQQVEKSKQLVKQQAQDLAADKQKLEKQKKEFDKKQEDAQKQHAAEINNLKAEAELVRKEKQELDKIRKELLNGTPLNDEQRKKIKVTLNNYNKEDFDIKGTVLQKYLGESDDVIIPEGVTEIGVNAFEGCSMESITIPKTVKRIGFGAFSLCVNLNRVYIEDLAAWCAVEYDAWEDRAEGLGHTLFECEYSLYLNRQPVTELFVPIGVTSIGDAMFSYCSSIRSVVLPKGVKSIGGVAFCNCKYLESITIPSSVKSIGQFAFGECNLLKIVHIHNVAAWCEIEYELSEEDTNFAFSSPYMLCVNGKFLPSLIIPDGVTEIRDFAFRECQSMYDIRIPNSVQSIGKGAFYNCANLRAVAIPEGVTELNQMFYLCPSLSWVGIPSSVKRIVGHDIFTLCDQMKKLIYQGTKAQWKEIEKESDCSDGYVSCADGNILINESSKFDIDGTVLTKYNGHDAVVVVPDRVTHIANGAFADCASFLKKVVLPTSLESMGDDVFGFSVELDASRVEIVKDGQKIKIKNG